MAPLTPLSPASVLNTSPIEYCDGGGALYESHGMLVFDHVRAFVSVRVWVWVWACLCLCSICNSAASGSFLHL